MDSACCPQLTLGEWGQELVDRLAGRRYPLGATFELTERCNLACAHCYIRQPAGSREAAAKELSLPQVKRILDQAAGAGCTFLTLTGGEVLLRSDFPEIYLHAKRAGMLVIVFSNGTLLTERMADLLAEYRPRSIEVTLYGHSQETYEAVTEVPGSHARCRAGIEMLVRRGLPLSLKATILKTNVHELPAMEQYAKELGVPFRYDALLWPRLDGGVEPIAYRLSAEEILELERDDPEQEREWQRLVSMLGSKAVRAEYVYSCGAGKRSFHVDASGKMGPCMMARRQTYDLVAGPFNEGWDGLLASLIGQKRSLGTECEGCRAGVLCMQCPAWSQIVHGDDETPDEFMCRLGKLRAAQWYGPEI